MSLSIDQLRAAFKTPERNEGNLPNNYYPFWNMKIGEQAVVRFLPDSNPENPLGFLVEKLMHTLEINGEKKSVPCLKMYDEDCPICSVSSAYYNADDKDNGKKYWRKKQHIAQALIIEDPLPADETTGETHEGKVRYLAIGWQLFGVIKEAFESGDLEVAPYEFNGGTDFVIKKSKQGDHATYALGSKFARKESDLDEDLIANLQLADLGTLLPKNPGREKVEAMLEAALTGGEYSESSTNESTSAPSIPSAPVSKPTPAPAAVTEETEDDTSGDFDDEADKILADIRKRKSAKAK